MNQKHTIYTLGTIDSIQTSILEKLKQKQTTSSDINQEPKLQKSSGNQLVHHNYSTSISAKTLYQLPICTGKSKFIKKPAKGKQEKIKEQKKEKQTILFKYFKRRIFTLPNTVEINPQNYKTFNLRKIIDWQMEATENLHLSKDTFYTAVAIAKNIYEKQRYQRFSHSVIEIQVASILSIAGKIQTNKLNFVDAISAVCGFPKSQIIQGEIFVMKALDFKIPHILIEQKIIEISNKWHNFVQQNLSTLKMEHKKVIFGPSTNLQDWEQDGKNNILHFCTIVDFLLLGFYQVVNYQKLDNFNSLFLQALFMFINYQNYQLFPIKPSQKTYVVVVFELFLKQKYRIEGEQFLIWTYQLIKNEERLRLVERVSKYFGLNFHFACSSEMSSGQSTTAKFIGLPQHNFQYLNQRYKRVILEE